MNFSLMIHICYLIYRLFSAHCSTWSNFFFSLNSALFTKFDSGWHEQYTRLSMTLPSYFFPSLRILFCAYFTLHSAPSPITSLMALTNLDK